MQSAKFDANSFLKLSPQDQLSKIMSSPMACVEAGIFEKINILELFAAVPLDQLSETIIRFFKMSYTKEDAEKKQQEIYLYQLIPPVNVANLINNIWKHLSGPGQAFFRYFIPNKFYDFLLQDKDAAKIILFSTNLAHLLLSDNLYNEIAEKYQIAIDHVSMVLEAIKRYQELKLRFIPTIPDEKEIIKIANTLKKLFSRVYDPLNDEEKSLLIKYPELASYLVQETGKSIVSSTLSDHAVNVIKTLTSLHSSAKEELLKSIIRTSSPNIIKWLIDQGVDVNVTERGWSLLRTVCDCHLVANLKALQTSKDLIYTELSEVDNYGYRDSILGITMRGVIYINPRRIAIANLLEKPVHMAELKQFKKILQNDLIKVNVIPVPADEKEPFNIKKLQLKPSFDDIIQITLTAPDRLKYIVNGIPQQIPPEYLQQCSLCITLKNGKTLAYQFKNIEQIYAIEAMLHDYGFKTTTATVHQPVVDWKESGVEGVYDKYVHNFYDAMHKRMCQRFKDLLVEQKKSIAETKSDIVVVELGCGKGKAVQSLLREAVASVGKARVFGYGFDYSETNIKAAINEYEENREHKTKPSLPPCEFKVIDVTKEECEAELKKIRDKHPDAKIYVICSGLLTPDVLNNAPECITVLQRIRRSKPDCIFVTGLKDPFYDEDMLKQVGFDHKQKSSDERFYCLEELWQSEEYIGLKKLGDTGLLNLSMCADPIQAIKQAAASKRLDAVTCLDLSYTDLSRYSKQELQEAFSLLPRLSTVLFVNIDQSEVDKLRSACDKRELVAVKDKNEFLSIYPVEYYPHLLNPAVFTDESKGDPTNFMQLVRYIGLRLEHSKQTKSELTASQLFSPDLTLKSSTTKQSPETTDDRYKNR